MTGLKRILLLFVILLLAGGLLLWRGPAAIRNALLGPPVPADRILVSGDIEAHQSVLGFTQVQAPLTELAFNEGVPVTKGTLLARVDDRLYRQQVEIDRANLRVAAAQVSVNDSQLAAARSNLSSDEADLAEKQRDLARAEDLVRTAAISIQARDMAYTAARQSMAAQARDQAMVRVGEANLTLAMANEAAVASKLALDEVTLSYTELRAPFDGVIAVRQAELGQLAGPGVAIFTLDDLDHPWLRAYVNEPDLGKVRLGQEVDVTTDSFPNKVYKGRISFISPNAEFTPKTVETHAERVTLVFRIKIDIDNKTHELLPGMPADASIPMIPPGQ